MSEVEKQQYCHHDMKSSMENMMRSYVVTIGEGEERIFLFNVKVLPPKWHGSFTSGKVDN